MGTRHLQISRQLATVKVEDTFVCQLQRTLQSRLASLPGGLKRGRRDAQWVGPHPVELLAQGQESAIAFAAHPVEDGFHAGGSRIDARAVGPTGDGSESLHRCNPVAQAEDAGAGGDC